VNTIKSAALLAVLLGVLYGVYVALSKPDFDRNQNSGEPAQPLNIEWGSNGALPPAPSPGSYSRGGNTSGASYQTYQSSPAASAERPSAFSPSYEPPATPSPAAPPFAATTSTDTNLAQSAYVTPAPPADAPSSTDSAPQPAQPVSEPVSPASAAAAAAPALAAYDLKRDLAEADQLIAENKYRAALAKLTPHYSSADLPADQRAVLLSWLDPLAGKVIYSREHLLASPHQVRKGETLYDVAHQYNVEYRLLQNINSKEVSDPLVLVPATELKVVPGPFRADVNLSTNELTLYVGDLYAGRFPFSLGDQPPQPGEFKVIDKRSQQKSYVGFDGRVIPANDPNNPYGGWWLSLGGEVALHGSPAIPGDQTLGCIALSTQDAKDVYGILSIGSEVKIRR
jgi:lipoprotein-anchoring transpeptidase ErfK/SrfK